MRPRTLEEVVGQRHLLAPGALLERAIRSDTLTSAVFWGPPGCGKTTLAEVIASTTQRAFCRLSAVAATVADVREIIHFAQRCLQTGRHGVVLFLDEIHRFNKAQQDVLLPFVENGTLLLIGATTENPFFALNAALLSRSRLFQFTPLSEDDIVALLERALHDEERGLGSYHAQVEPEALRFLATACDGDARVALNALELAVESAPRSPDTPPRVCLADAEASLQKKHIVYDRNGDAHYDTISAYIKSLRGSDPDAALYWLAKMLEAGEDPRFIARRMVIFASEDIGCADPLALPQAVAAFEAVERVGMPEAQINLGHVTVYLACAPKSNAAYMALCKAQEDVRSARTMEVPLHLRDAHYQGAKQLGHGEDYKYAHDYEGHFVPQDYLPQERRYYEPTQQGWEAKIAERLAEWRRQSAAARAHTRPASSDESGAAPAGKR
ncbi:MAG: replication-associated recombination protein A [bacterium]|nr:replication-associated recombination protein A [bacterium]